MNCPKCHHPYKELADYERHEDYSRQIEDSHYVKGVELPPMPPFVCSNCGFLLDDYVANKWKEKEKEKKSELIWVWIVGVFVFLGIMKFIEIVFY